MKFTYYFPHKNNARTDEKLIKLMSVLGLEGYGLYWCLVEKLHDANGKLELDYESIAFDLRTSVELVKNVINNFKLFKISENFFESDRVKQNLKNIKTKSEKASKSAKAKWNKDLQQQNVDANAMRTQCERNANKEKKIKENKTKENKIKEEESKDVVLIAKNESSLTAHQEFVSKFGKVYTEITNHPFKVDKKHFIMAANLIEKYGIELVRSKASILCQMCKKGEVWFVKNGMADFTIEHLSRHWNSIIPLERISDQEIKEIKFQQAMQEEERKREQFKANLVAATN